MKKIFFLLPLLLTPTTFANFSDVPENHPYLEAINYAKENNIVNGYDDGTFRPEDKISREEFTKIIIGANFSDSEIYGEDCFSDVESGEFEKYICTAKREGIINGYDDGTFRPKNKISFLESAKIIVNGLGKGEEAGNEEGIEKYGEYLAEKRAIPMSIDDVDSKINRGEMVEIVWRLKATYLSTSYKIRSDKVYFNKNEIKGVDIQTFEVLIDETREFARYANYSRDKNNVYWEGQKIEGVDPKTSEILSDCYIYYLKDKYNVYLDGKKIEEADPETFKILNCYYDDNFTYTKDKNNCYKDGEIVDMSECDKYIEVDIGFNYIKKDGQIFYKGEIIEDVDVETFEVLNDQYAKDESYIYIFGNKNEFYNPETFEILGTDGIRNYVKDKNGVYYDGIDFEDQEVKGIDIDSLELVNFSFGNSNLAYLKDKNSIYYQGEILEGSDPETFKYYDGYAKDKNNLYILGTYEMGISNFINTQDAIPINENDKMTEETRESIKKVNKRFSEIDKDSFERIGKSFYKDKNNIYLIVAYNPFDSLIILEEADPETFEILDNYYEKDKNNCYKNGKIVNMSGCDKITQ